MGNNRKGGKWASDEDAGSLLAGILDDTETAAAAEEAALQQNIEAKRAQEQAERERVEQLKAQAARQRIEGEAQRQEQIAKRRTERMKALQIEDLKANGQWVDPVESQSHGVEQSRPEHQTPLPEEMQAQLEALQERMQELQHKSQNPIPAEPVMEQPAGPMVWLVMAAAIIAVLGGSAVLGAMSLNAYSPDQTSYAKVTLQPRDERQLITQVGIEAIKPEPAAPKVSEKPKDTKPRVNRKPRPNNTKPKPPKPEERKPLLRDFDFDKDGDIFGDL